VIIKQKKNRFYNWWCATLSLKYGVVYAGSGHPEFESEFTCQLKTNELFMSKRRRNEEPGQSVSRPFDI